MTPAIHLPNDSESLQADVMRFMAIIAFCLIAILALVRNVEPADVTQAEPDPVVAPEPIAEPEPAPEPDPPSPESLHLAVAEPEPVSVVAGPAPVASVPKPVASVPKPAPHRATPEPVAEPEHEPRSLEPVSSPAEEALSAEDVNEATRIEPAAAPPTPREEQEGLILRFASDKDFLRLIARGDITVYAYQQSDVLSLDGSYRFLDAPAPGQVYELLTASIPDLILDALKRERTDIRGYRWGIALPRRISAQIERHLENVESGQLVIDRYGDVHHVAAS